MAPDMEGEKIRQEEFAAEDAPMTAVRNSREIGGESKRKNGRFLEGRKSVDEEVVGDLNMEGSGPAGGSDLEVERPTAKKKKQYLGRWDSELGQMVYECIDEDSSTILMERDPRSDTYHPYVVTRSKEKCLVVSTLSDRNGNLSRKLPDDNSSYSNKKLRVKPTEAQLQTTPPETRTKAPNGSVSNWKKRARHGADSTQLKDQKGASDDGRKEDQRELEVANYQSKKR